MKVTQNRKRLYNLCYRSRRKGYRIDSRKRTIYIPYHMQEMASWSTVRTLQQEYGFVFQTEID